MNIKSERGQSLVLIAIAVICLALLIMAVTGNLPGMKKGADTIGESIGGKIDDLTAPEIAMTFWVNNQRLYPNKHSVQQHGADASLATDCYNRNGAFLTARSGLDWHLLCRDNDGSVRTTVWTQESENSNRFHMKSAYTPKNGNWQAIQEWMARQRYFKASMPSETIFIIDGNVAP